MAGLLRRSLPVVDAPLRSLGLTGCSLATTRPGLATRAGRLHLALPPVLLASLAPALLVTLRVALVLAPLALALLLAGV